MKTFEIQLSMLTIYEEIEVEAEDEEMALEVLWKRLGHRVLNIQDEVVKKISIKEAA